MMNDKEFMEIAISEAKLATDTWQNPRVGAVIVKNNQILSRGHTQQFGGFHAERNAITKLSREQLSGATLYVTLEPCDHQGKQPPCSQLIIDSGIKRVVIAQVDPHSLVTGKGIASLKDQGIEVETGLLAKEASAINPYYTFFFHHRRPWITVKQAVSLDYRVSAADGVRTTITNQKVYQRVHQERANFQGIVIGSSTAIIDNPSLLAIGAGQYPPIRIILDRRGRLAGHPELKILTDERAPTWIFTTKPQLIDKMPANVKVIVKKECSIESVIQELTDQGIQSLYVEGGPTVGKAFLMAGMVDEFLTYLSPNLLGRAGVPGIEFQSSRIFDHREVTLLGDNVRISERNEINV